MAGESTNPPPSGPGANSGGPPINDQGAARPNPAPPPPPSVPPVPNNTAEVVKETVKEVKDAKKVLEEFEKKQKEVNQAIEAHKASLERIKTLNDEYRKATEARKEAEKKAEEETKKLTEQFAQHKKEDGTWQENTEAAQKQYQEQLQKITDSAKEAAAAEEKAKIALVESVAAEQKSKEEAEAAMKAMEALRDTINGIDQAMAGTLEPVIKKLSESLQAATKETADFRQIALADLGQSLAGVAIKGAKSEERIGGAGGAKEGEAIKKDAAESKASAIFGAVAIGKAIDEFLDEQKKLFAESNPQASAEEIAKMVKDLVTSGKAREQAKLRLDQKNQAEVAAINQKHIEAVMKEKQVDETAATAIVEQLKQDKSSDIYKELEKLNSTQKKTEDQITKLTDKQFEQIMLAKESERRRMEEVSEGKGKDSFVDTLIKGIDDFGEIAKEGNSFLKDLLSDTKKDGLISTLLVVATVAIGATLGYIWAKIKVIVGLLSFIPGLGGMISGGFAKAVSGATGMFGKIGAGATGFLSKLFGPLLGPLKFFIGPLKSIFGVVTKLFPALSSGLTFFPRLASIFMKAFKFLGPIAMVLGFLFDAISGAFKGVKEIPGIKGIIMGALAGIISGLTFGLVDFKTIFGFFKTYLTYFFDAVGKFVEVFMWIAEPIITAVKNIVNIFQGEGSIVSKIFKTIWELVKGLVSFWLRFLLAQMIRIPWIITKAFIDLIAGIATALWDLQMWWIQLWVDAAVWLWDWFTSGDWLKDIEKLGEWLYEELVNFFVGVIDSIADALGDLPFVGDALKEFFGGGSNKEEQLSTSIEKAADTANNMVNESAATREAVLSLPMETAMHPLATEAVTALPLSTGEMVAVPVSAASGSQLAQASAMASTAQIAAGSGAISAAINAPTTTVVGGGGGDSAVIMPSTSRNNDPTFRALLFLEQPAL